jgi:hypothetical protein
MVFKVVMVSAVVVQAWKWSGRKARRRRADASARDRRLAEQQAQEMALAE